MDVQKYKKSRKIAPKRQKKSNFTRKLKVLKNKAYGEE